MWTTDAHIEISIHTPATGVTYAEPPWNFGSKISIHTTPKGVTVSFSHSPKNTCDFNPHSREGSDV